MTLGSPDLLDGGGLKSPHTDYVKFLPKQVPLPTFYSEEERGLLLGTSLEDALSQKLASLEREYDMLKESTMNISWSKKSWWDEATGILTSEDWKLADALYRSRALELPRGVGDSMVPVVDMANHLADNRSNARFEVDDDGNALLVVRDEKSINKGDEITIMYGAGGACEMIFSYGFLDDGASSAREMFLNIAIPEDDPLRLAKIRYAEEAPGVRIFVDNQGQVQWDSNYVWWASVNEEDGLDFRVLQTNDGQKELVAVWRDKEFQAHELKDILMNDPLRDLFVLRANVLVEQRLEEQGMKLAQSEQAYEDAFGQPGVSELIWKLVGRLRGLELELVTQGYQRLQSQVRRNLIQ
jgi:hypothetical protein